MAHHKSAIKRIRKSRKQKLYNRAFKRMIKMAIRSVLEAKTYEEAALNMKKADSILDRAAAKNILHLNNSANKKSGLRAVVNKLKTA